MNDADVCDALEPVFLEEIKFLEYETGFDVGKKQGALEELVKQVKDLEIIKKLLTNDIDCVGNLNIVKNRNKLWFLTGEINIVGNQIEKVNNQIKNLENKKEEGCE